jgi:hypothetical protein
LEDVVKDGWGIGRVIEVVIMWLIALQSWKEKGEEDHVVSHLIVEIVLNFFLVY